MKYFSQPFMTYFFYRDHLWTKAKKPKDLLDNNTDGAETIEDGLEDVESEITRYKSAKKYHKCLLIWNTLNIDTLILPAIILKIIKAAWAGQAANGWPKKLWGKKIMEVDNFQTYGGRINVSMCKVIWNNTLSFSNV